MGQANAVSDLERAEHASSVLAKRFTAVNTVGTQVNPATEETLAGQFAILIDDVSTTGVTYVGKATIGTATSSALWQIRKIDEAGTPVTMVVTWADSNANYDNVWDNRTSLTYA